ncbi:hypothetical protein [Succinivibrio dextrinosolvens]|uniref:hypothetical protein n=1 Tax=Succinivibrio dextrinosolvens TaxID=83771 RepID=UPI002479BA58|nr:hypothetical protein [Succinivibrio dextrinosolvens]
MAMDSARLLTISEENYNKIQNQGFFERCWSRMSGEAGRLERENTHSLIEMQQIAIQYLKYINENMLIFPYAIINLQNNLNSLIIKQESTQAQIKKLVTTTSAILKNLQQKTSDNEGNVNLLKWNHLLRKKGLEEQYPTPILRMLEVTNQFYEVKKGKWDFDDILILEESLQSVKLSPEKKYSLRDFIKDLIQEILSHNAFGELQSVLNKNCPKSIENINIATYDEVSSPLFIALHGVKNSFLYVPDFLKATKDKAVLSADEIIEKFIFCHLDRFNVNIDYESSLLDLAIEFLGAVRLCNLLNGAQEMNVDGEKNIITDIDPNTENTKEIEQTKTEEKVETVAPDVYGLESFKLIKQGILQIPGNQSDVYTVDAIYIPKTDSFEEVYLFVLSNGNVFFSRDLKNFELFYTVTANVWRFKRYSYNQVVLLPTSGSSFLLITIGKSLVCTEKTKDNPDYQYSSIADIKSTDKYEIVAYQGSHYYTFIETGVFWDSKDEELIEDIYVRIDNKISNQSLIFESKNDNVYCKWDFRDIYFDVDNNKCLLVLEDHSSYKDESGAFTLAVLYADFATLEFREVLKFKNTPAKYESRPGSWEFGNSMYKILGRIDNKYYISSYDYMYESQDGIVWNQCFTWPKEKDNVLNRDLSLLGITGLLTVNYFKLNDNIFVIYTYGKSYSDNKIKGVLINLKSNNYKVINEISTEQIEGFKNSITKCIVTKDEKIILMGDKCPLLYLPEWK